MSTLLTSGGHEFELVNRQLTEFERREAVADLIERLMPTVQAGYHAADDATLTHEAERLECLEQTALIRRMREIVAAEQAGRPHAEGVASHA